MSQHQTRPSPSATSSSAASSSTDEHHDVVIIGTGFAGLGMAIDLLRQQRRNFVLLEKATEVGGTWRENTYPGCACDVQSHLYSFSFEPNPHWSRMFPSQGELFTYLQRCAEKYQVMPHIRFGSEMTSAEFDDVTRRWRVTTQDGRRFTCRALVLGTGPLHRPSYPTLPGLADFEGPVFHSAEWNHEAELRGKRIGVVGTGASAIQFIPQIAPDVERLTVFQRTPPWVMPKPDRPVRQAEQRTFQRRPAVQKAVRNSLYWRLESRFLAFRHPSLMRGAEALVKAHMRKHIKDPALRDKLTPNYTMGCKRTLLSNDYYPALARPNVHVETSGITEVRSDRVVTQDGAEHPVDALIMGTGFQVADAMEQLPLTGSGGVKLSDAWSDGVEAHLGTTIAGFPNLFLILGPNTGLGHNSMIFMIESQIRYIRGCLDLMESSGASRMEVREPAQRLFNRELQSDVDGEVWSPGNCVSWYLDRRGVNRAAWPGWTWQFWWRTRKPDPRDYRLSS